MRMEGFGVATVPIAYTSLSRNFGGVQSEPTGPGAGALA